MTQPDGTGKLHAILSPSSADRWVQCPGSVYLSRGKSDPESSYSTEGTDYHEVAALCLEQNLDAATLVGKEMLSGAIVTEENAGYVQQYLDHVRASLGSVRGGSLSVEKKVPLTWLTGEPDAYGHLDAMIVSQDTELIIHDLKFGRGVEVEAKDNRQEMIYAAAAIQELELWDVIDTVRLVIDQPRVGNPKEWVVPIVDLKLFCNEITAASAAVARANALTWTLKNDYLTPDDLTVLQPSEKACRWCRAKGDCVALAGFVETTMTDGFTVEVDGVSGATYLDPASNDEASRPTQTGEALGRAMDRIPLVELWATGVRAESERRLLADEPVIGEAGPYKLVLGKRGARKWTDEETVEETFKAYRIKADDRYDMTLISPAVAEKQFEKTQPHLWKKLAALYSQADGKKSVANALDPRPAILMEKPEEGFEETADDLL